MEDPKFMSIGEIVEELLELRIRIHLAINHDRKMAKGDPDRYTALIKELKEKTQLEGGHHF